MKGQIAYNAMGAYLKRQKRWIPNSKSQRDCYLEFSFINAFPQWVPIYNNYAIKMQLNNYTHFPY